MSADPRPPYSPEQPNRFCPEHGRWSRPTPRLAGCPELRCDCPPTWERHVRETVEWQRATFPQSTALSAAIHLVKEAAELVEPLRNAACGSRMFDRAAEMDKARAELADMLLLLLCVNDRLGGDAQRLLEDAAAKLAANRRRKWAAPDADGVVEHVRDER